MIKLIVGLTTAATVSAFFLSQEIDVENTLSNSHLRQDVGISDVVWTCANNVLAGATTDELLTLIADTDNVGTAAETDTQAALRECVMKDPFGWGENLTPDQRVALSIMKGSTK